MKEKKKRGRPRKKGSDIEGEIPKNVVPEGYVGWKTKRKSIAHIGKSDTPKPQTEELSEQA